MTKSRNPLQREQILAGAAQLLDEGHFGDLTVEALARTLRMSKSTLYRYFVSKDALVADLIRARCDAADPDSVTSYAEWSITTARFLEQVPAACLREPERMTRDSRDHIDQVRTQLEESLVRLIEATPGCDGTRADRVAPAIVAAAWEVAKRAGPSEGRAETVSDILRTFRYGLPL